MAQGYSYKVNKSKDGDIELAVTVDKARFADEKAKAFTRLSADVSLPGFRKGKGPENLIEAKLGTRLYEETINRMIPAITAEIMEEEKYNPITQVQYSVKKVTDDAGLEFSASFVDFPDFKLGDFTKIKIKEESAEVTDEDISNSIKRLLELDRQQKDLIRQAEEKKQDTDEADSKKDTSAEKKEAKKEEKPDLDKQVKELTDEQVKDMKIGFESVKDLKDELRERLKADKVRMMENKRLQTMLSEAVKASKVNIPAKLIEAEVQAGSMTTSSVSTSWVSSLRTFSSHRTPQKKNCVNSGARRSPNDCHRSFCL
ncbi:MAG: Trigger factor [candidate division WS6 bacterium OLB20]|uniref:Trigger factor n=1 Tax=candidate division WS6 bacterium OLB20 TaxID=1617426 RepID=A0A136LVM7_9BACT|nr:MAG: Trigger factor [candidate division WS6 bacterium OLB20]